jgi:hypothetical protein
LYKVWDAPGSLWDYPAFPDQNIKVSKTGKNDNKCQTVRIELIRDKRKEIREKIEERR